MLQVVVILYAGDYGRQGIRDYESKVISILNEHQGVLVSACAVDNQGDDPPDEIHIIQFPSMEEFNLYKSDPRVTALSALREKVIRKTEIYFSETFHNY